MQTPVGMLDCKSDETASVDSSADIIETSVPYVTPKAEELPQVEDTPKDIHWSDFKEDVPVDSPSQHLTLEGCISNAFDKDFNSVLYSSCEDYQKWVIDAADLMQTKGQLKEKVNIVFCVIQNTLVSYACLKF